MCATGYPYYYGPYSFASPDYSGFADIYVYIIDDIYFFIKIGVLTLK